MIASSVLGFRQPVQLSIYEAVTVVAQLQEQAGFKVQATLYQEWQGSGLIWSPGPERRPQEFSIREVEKSVLLKPMDIKREAKVPYTTVIQWLTVGHPRAGVLASIDFAVNGKRHSFRIRRQDWEAFLARLQTVPRERQQAPPLPRPTTSMPSKKGMFVY